MKATKADKKAAWMAAFEKYVLEFEPKYAGKIEWESAEFFFNSGDRPLAAAEQYVDNRQEN